MSESDVKPVKATSLKVGNYLVFDNDVYVVKSSEKSKAGKHGHAKVIMTVENLFTGNKKSIIAPGDDKFMQPVIEKSVAQILSISEDSVQLMDAATFETYEAALPDNLKLEEGGHVDIWQVLGRRIIRNLRSEGSTAHEYA
jgi:translation initiation factor 5A